MQAVTLALDLLTLVSAFAAAWLWFQASGRRIRRVSYHEEIDAADLNRMVVALNRTQILNERAALASGIAALFAALRWVAVVVKDAL
ncbi:MAG: hypothetical protein JO048_11720 [Methylobacteriaceae bacterium]|nr:hypothetical protein [Methylobacteriaceae bacterium]